MLSVRSLRLRAAMSLTLTNIETAIGSIGRLSASAPVQIGGLVLTGMEVPDRIG